MEQEGANTPSGVKGAAIVITKDDIKSSSVPPSRPAGAAPQQHPMPEAPPATSHMESAAVSGRPAGFWLRLLAKVLDIGLTMLFFLVASAACSALVYFGCLGRSMPLWEEVRPLLWRIAWTLLAGYAFFYAVYSIVTHAANGCSIGKSICGIRVVTAGRPPTSAWAALPYFGARFMVAMISITLLSVGHILAGFRRDKRALHDMVVGSRVVRQVPSDTLE